MAGGSTTTKSIDVGGVFLMDLAVNDSDSLCEHELGPPGASSSSGTHHISSSTHRGFAAPSHRRSHADDANNSNNPARHNPTHLPHHQHPHRNQHLHHRHQDKSIRLSPTYHLNNDENGNQAQQQAPRSTMSADAPPRKAPHQQQPPSSDYLGSSLDRLASVINCDERHHQQEENENEDEEGEEQLAQYQSAIGGNDGRRRAEGFLSSSVAQRGGDVEFGRGSSQLSSLSDESYVIDSSGGTSLTSGTSDGAYELSDGCCGAAGAVADDDEALGAGEDRASTTTREDSGVLDMKDFEGPGGVPLADTKQHIPLSLEQRPSGGRSPRPPQEKSISANIMATNLINTNANSSSISKMNFKYQKQQAAAAAANKSITLHNDNSKQDELAESSGAIYHHNTNNNNHHHHNHNHSNRSSRRSVSSASLPIQVPARQMKRNLNRMKLNLMKEQEEGEQQQPRQQLAGKQPKRQLAEHEPSDDADDESSLPMRRGDRNRPALENIAAFCGGQDDDSAFLDQEFNANHQNHYPIDELESEHLTAEDDPMKLFASIQALAKSLHEDAELFGSLPPKRMLESPIRSLALV